MPNTKDRKKSDSMGSMDQSSDPNKQSSKMEDDEMKTSGGRHGNFSDKNRESEEQWSPGSAGASDQ